MSIEPTTVYGIIFLGVVAGIITSAFLFFIGLIFSQIIIPWYQGLIYKGIDLGGQWENEYENETGRYVFRAAIKQNGHNLKGSLSITKSAENNSGYVTIFHLTGSTWEGFMLVNLQSVDRKELAFASGLFKIKKRGSCLVGYLIFRSSMYDDVQPEAAIWKRVAK